MYTMESGQRNVVVGVLAVGVAVVAGAAFGACGGDVVVDGGSQQAGGAGGTGPGSTTSPGPGPGPGPDAASTGASGPGPGPGPGPSTSTGPQECLSCAEYITDCVSGEPSRECDVAVFCRGSEQLLDSLIACICNACAMQCVNTCAGMAGDDPQVCGQCQQQAASNQCAPEFGECANDV